MHLLNREHSAYKRRKKKRRWNSKFTFSIHIRNTNLLIKTNTAVCIEYSSNSNNSKKKIREKRKKKQRNLYRQKSICTLIKNEFVLSFEQIHSIHMK
jgi:hypothetical protein